MATAVRQIMDGEHELVGRVVVLNSGGPLMTIVGVSAIYVPKGVEAEPPRSCEFDVIYFDGSLQANRIRVDARWVELLTPEDAAFNDPGTS
jgi:hypothetical protein